MRTRDQYVDGLKKQMDFWNAGVARWEELARYNAKLIEGASIAAWTELRKGADEAWDRMRDAAGTATDYFGKIPATAKPAPRKSKRRAKAR